MNDKKTKTKKKTALIQQASKSELNRKRTPDTPQSYATQTHNQVR